MKPPHYLATGPAQDTFRHIAAHADGAKHALNEIARDPDANSPRVQALRRVVDNCCTHIFAAIALGPPEARDALRRGLDNAQRDLQED